MNSRFLKCVLTICAIAFFNIQNIFGSNFIEYLSFETKVITGGNLACGSDVFPVFITWSTATEMNCNFFQVERSPDGINTIIIATIPGAINSTTTKTYSFLDNTASPGANYYRIVAYDFSGNTQPTPFNNTNVPIPMSKDWKYMTSPEYAQVASTSSNSNDYIWHEESNITQGVHLNLIPGEQRLVVLEQNNHIINFTTRNSASSTSNTNPLIAHIQVNIDNQGYTTIFDASSDGGVKGDVVWQGSSSFFNDAGNQHTLRIKWIDATSGGIWIREFDVFVIPSAQKFYKDNFCNTMRLWHGNSPNDDVPALLSEGFDPYNMKQIQFYYIASEKFISCMQTKGFKIYFLDYAFGGQDIRNNAAVFASATKYISSINDDQKIIAGGVSMGGVIARYALAKAEGQGNPLPAAKFVSLDSPQQGAILSPTLQDFRKQSIQNSGGNAFQDYAISNEAAKELLIYNTYDPSGSVHSTFYNELDNLNGDGYPHQTANIGVSFATTNPNPNSGTWISITCQSNCGLANMQLPKDFGLSADEMLPGSYLPTFLTNVGPTTQMIPIVQNADVNWMFNFLAFIPAAVSIVTPYSLFATAFSPFTFNSLYPTITMTRSKDPTYVSYVSALDKSSINGLSKFNPIIGAPGSQTIEPAITSYHDIVPDDIINPLLNALLVDNVYLQNKSITTMRNYVAGKTITAGNHVNPDQNVPTGDFNVESGAVVTFKAGEEISLQLGFNAKPGSVFHAYIATPVVNCDGISENQMKTANVTSSLPIASSESLDIEEIQASPFQQLNFSIFPNPTEGKFQLILNTSFSDLNENNSNANISVENIFGQIVYNSFNHPLVNSTAIDLSSEPKGVYFVKVESRNHIHTKKVVVQ